MLIDREAIDAAVEVPGTVPRPTSPSQPTGTSTRAIAQDVRGGRQRQPDHRRQQAQAQRAAGRGRGAGLPRRPVRPQPAGRRRPSVRRRGKRVQPTEQAGGAWPSGTPSRTTPRSTSAGILSRLEHLTYDLSGNSDSDVGRLAPMGELFPRVPHIPPEPPGPRAAHHRYPQAVTGTSTNSSWGFSLRRSSSWELDRPWANASRPTPCWSTR